MKLTNVKTMAAKLITVGLLAGAFVIAAPAKAQAQGISVGVQFGNPTYSGPSSYDHLRFEDRREAFLRQQAWERQQAWQRQQAWERQQAWQRQEAWERQQAWQRPEARERRQSYSFDRDDRERDYRDGDHDRH